MSSPSAVRGVSSVCAVVAAMACAAAVVGPVSALPAPAQQQPQQQDAVGLGTVLWSVVDGCFDADSAEPTAVCLKSKALTALDRALAKPTVTIAGGVSLASRAGKSLADPSTEKADRAALDAAKDPEHKSAMLDDMLANRVDMLMATKSIVLDGLAVQEGRSKKKEQKAFQMAIMMAGMTAVAVMGPMAFGFIAMLAAKALLISKIALVLSGIIALKKLLQPQQGGHETEAVQVSSSHHYGRSMNLDAHDMAYSGQLQQ
ncbi:Protein of unknown function DUF1676 [Cinara cedri]|uniref:Uncharacterized protein n=1 Tax=Cinara cedri TaxID=506608 RepID=A0A5E4N6B7_9HEMI|nr:Protein of unknown function DUF1676 [Cinara cedri]